MRTSENIDQIATALAHAQGELTDPKKDAQGYGYKYAELSSYLQIVRPVMARHGLSLTQFAEDAEPLAHGDIRIPRVQLTTRLTHASGQWYEALLSMEIEPKKGLSHAQNVGATITYARKYAVACMLGIAQEDDDAEVPDVVSEEQARTLLGKLNEAGLNVGKVLSAHGVNRVDELLARDYENILKTIEQKRSAGAQATAERGADLAKRAAAMAAEAGARTQQGR